MAKQTVVKTVSATRKAITIRPKTTALSQKSQTESSQKKSEKAKSQRRAPNGRFA